MSKLTVSVVKNLQYKGKPENLFDGGGLWKQSKGDNNSNMYQLY